MSEQIAVDVKRLNELEKIEKMMRCLEAGGVDNWDNYCDSLAPMHREELINEYFDEIMITLSSSAFHPTEVGAGIDFGEVEIRESKKLFEKLIEELEKNDE